MAKTNQEKQGRQQREKSIVFDFDGVIHRYSRGYADGSIYDGPVEGIAATLNAVHEAGFKIIIYSTRCHSRIYNGKYISGQAAEIAAWMNGYNLYYDEIYVGSGKPVCHLMIDDNAYRFDTKRWNNEQISTILNLAVDR